METIKARDAAAANVFIEPTGRVLDLQGLDDVDATADDEDLATQKYMITEILEEIHDETDRIFDPDFVHDTRILNLLNASSRRHI